MERVNRSAECQTWEIVLLDVGEHCPVLGGAGENEQRCRKNMTCKDSWKETGLFSLEDAGDRREEQSDAPQRELCLWDSSCAAGGTTGLGLGTTWRCRRRDVGRDCPQKRICALAGGLKI